MNLRMSALLCGLVLLATACGGTATNPAPRSSSLPAKVSAPVTIEYWYPYGGTVGKAVEAAVSRFNQEQSGRITVKPTFQGTFDQQLAKVRAAAAGGGLPQVIAARESDVTQFGSSNLAVPLDPYVKDGHNGLSSQQLADIYPGVLARTKLPVYGNQTLAWPLGNTAASWFYNLNLMHQAGINDPPSTWDQVLADAKKVKAATGQPLWDLRADQAGPIFIDALWTYGVPWLSSDGKTSNFNNPSALKVLQMFRQMVDDGTMVVSASAEQDFPNGRGAMLWASSGNVVAYSNQIKGFQWGVGLVPHAKNAKRITEMFGSVDTMFKGTQDQQLASWIFMKYMAGAGNQSQFAADTGYFPSEQSSARSAAIQSASQQVPQYRAAVQTIAPYMQLLPQSAALDQVRNHIATDDVTAVLLKKMTPDDGARKLKADADQAIKQAGQ